MMKKIKKPKTIINFILDQTGSMEAIKSQTISGFNEYLQTLKNEDTNISFSLTLFNSNRIEKRYIGVPVSEVKKLTSTNFIPSGMTPLYDAVVDSVEALVEKIHGEEPQPSVVVVIMTDGEENSSTKHTEKCLKELVESLTAKGNFTFTYLGANQDAWAISQKFGISAGNAMAYAATGVGVTKNFKNLAMATSNYTANVLRSSALGEKSFSTMDFFAEVKGGEDNDA